MLRRARSPRVPAEMNATLETFMLVVRPDGQRLAGEAFRLSLATSGGTRMRLPRSHAYSKVKASSGVLFRLTHARVLQKPRLHEQRHGTLGSRAGTQWEAAWSDR